jgi:hypothetical protein
MSGGGRAAAWGSCGDAEKMWASVERRTKRFLGE